MSAIGRGNDIVMYAIKEVANRIVGMEVETIFGDIGAFWTFRECHVCRDCYHR